MIQPGKSLQIRRATMVSVANRWQHLRAVLRITGQLNKNTGSRALGDRKAITKVARQEQSFHVPGTERLT